MSSSDGADSNSSNASLASYNPGDYDQEDIDAYENYKYNMNEQKPGFPVMEIDEFLRMERSSIATGGLAGVLGV